MRLLTLAAALLAATLGVACATTPSSASEKAEGAETSTPPSDDEEFRAGGGHPGGPLGGHTSLDPARNLEAALRDPDPRSRASSLEALHTVFQGHSQLSEIIASVLVQTYAEIHEIEKMRAWSRKVQVRDDPAYADVLNGMAYAYAEIGEHLSEGLIRVDQGLAVLDRLEARLVAHGGEARPEGPLGRRRAAFLDTRGWLYFKLDKVEMALADLDRAAAMMDDPEIHWHRCQVLERLERKEEAARACADSLATGEKFTEEARARLALLAGHPADAIAAAKERARHRKSTAVLRRSIDRPTPRLELRDREGELLPLGGEERPEGIQVFWLWATWCKPCLEELPLLEALAGREENQDVDFLAVNVDEDPALALRFLERRKLNLPVAFAEPQATLRALNVGGLPALFVRDAAGRIRFVHLGANPAIGEILQGEIDALEASQQAPAGP